MSRKKLELFYKDLNEMVIDELFFSPSGIHGVNHTKNVLYYAFNICCISSFTISQKEHILFAAAFHDIGRTRDGVDPTHGLKSWKKIKKKALFNDLENINDQACIKFLVINHCIDDEAIDWSEKNEKYRSLLYALKDADAIDRTRINDFDLQYLRLSASKKFLEGMLNFHEKNISS